MASRSSRKRAQKRKQKQRQRRGAADDDPYAHTLDEDGLRRILPRTATLSSRWTTITASYIFKDAFRLRTLLALGALAQMALSAGLGQPWRHLPAAALLLLAVQTTLAQIVSPDGYGDPFIAGAVRGRSTAVLPRESGDSTGRALVVFHFGARFNHPLGLLAPGGRTMTGLFRATIEALEADRSRSTTQATTQAYGLLGANLFRGGERASHATILLVLYFDSVEGLQRFARSAVHEQASRWLGDNRRRYPHLSAFHETFCVPAGGYETLYINTAPVLLGNAYCRRSAGERGRVVRGGQAADKGVGPTVTIEDEEGEKKEEEEDSGGEWINALVDADDRRLRTMGARMSYLAF